MRFHQRAIHNAIDKCVGKTLVTTISCTVRFGAFVLLQSFMSRPCQHHDWPSHPMSWQLAYTKNILQAFKARIKVLGHKSKACLVSNKRYGVTITKLSVLVHDSNKIVVALDWNSACSQHSWKKKHRNKKEKSVAGFSLGLSGWFCTIW